jgi:hypothetical protein
MKANIKIAMIRAKNKADGEKDSPEMDMPESTTISGREKESDEVIDLPYLLQMELETVEDYKSYLQGNISPKAKKLITELLIEEQTHVMELKELMGITGQELEQVTEDVGEGESYDESSPENM